jgi:hypothetical protein
MVFVVAAGGCGAPGGQSAQEEALVVDDALSWDVLQDSTHRVASIGGFSGPEAVRYDADQDVWFVSNFDGPGGEKDANGFISRVSAESGEVLDLRFAMGTAQRPLHAPRGMWIAGDTLWAVDVDGLHGFDRHTGGSLAFIDLSFLDPGFLNDVARGPDGALYVTDTGRSRLYRVLGSDVSVALADSVLGNPNGITWDDTRAFFVMVPWDPGFRVSSWRVGEAVQPFGPGTTPGRLDGIEPLDRRLLVASQRDSTIMLMDAGEIRPLIRVAGAPADIGVDRRRRRVAVPYIALNRVDVWQLPPSG